MLYNIQHHRITFAATSSLRLLHYMSNLIRKRMNDSQKPTGTDRKEREKRMIKGKHKAYEYLFNNYFHICKC